jgi:FAD/FMN-containing dehydrogenase
MTTLQAAAVENFRANLRGGVIAPGEADYEAARKVYNGMIDKRPALIARPVDGADVSAAIRFARDHQLLLAVRGGGHNGGGLGICDDGLVIDLSAMKGIHVDPKARTARVGGGCVWGEVDHATHAYGLAVPTGIISTTGVGGLTLGGGVGNLSRKCGLTIDNLLEVDMVLADGTIVTANADEYPDLFWAVRGGGGNFGVVTSFLFRLHPIHTNYAGPMIWPLERAREIMQWYREFLPSAPDELSGWFAFLTVPPVAPFPEPAQGKKMCAVFWCFTGPMDKAEGIFQPIRTMFGPPAVDFVGPIPHPAMQSMFDGLYPPALQWYWRGDYVKEIPDAAIDKHLEFAKHLPTPLSTMHMYPIDGAASRVGASDTAWAYRDAKWAGVFAGIDPDPANAAKIRDWTVSYQQALHPYSMGGSYINFMMEEGQERIRATYGPNYDRLAKVKAKYDPENVFRVNQNIKPAA